MTSADLTVKVGDVQWCLVATAAFVFGTASGSRFVLGGKDFAGMDGGVASVSVLKGAAEVCSHNLAVWHR